MATRAARATNLLDVPLQGCSCWVLSTVILGAAPSAHQPLALPLRKAVCRHCLRFRSDSWLPHAENACVTRVPALRYRMSTVCDTML